MKPGPLPTCTWTLSLALLLPTAVGAQEVWRCGADGRSYSATPCAEGHRIEVPAARPADDVAAAQAVAQRESVLAQTQQRERARLEAQQRGNGLGAIAAPVPVNGLKAASAKKPAQRPRPAEAGTWRAVVPASRHRPG